MHLSEDNVTFLTTAFQGKVSDMNRTISTETNRSAVPLQRATDTWANEPGYGGSRTAWDEFNAAIDAQLEQLTRKYSVVRQAGPRAS